MLDRIVTVVRNRPLTGGHFLLCIEAPEQAAAARPGQFAMIRLLGRTDVLLRRPMSIYDVGDVGPDITDTNNPLGTKFQPRILQVLYKAVGRGTRIMAELQAGDEVAMLAPLGHGFFPEEYLQQAGQSDEVLLVAGGIGIAALLLPARDLDRAGFRQKLFFGGRTRDDLVGLEQLEPLTAAIELATEDGSRGERGYVTRPLEQYLEQNEGRQFLLMACGPWAMLAATANLARRYGHPCLVSMENRMGCALGVCLGCSIPVHGTGHGAYERVCTEGPVFWAEHVVWNGREL